MLAPMLDPAILAPERIRGLRRDEYEELVNLGVFDDQRIELLRGMLVEMSPQGEPHARITAWLQDELRYGLERRRYEIRGHTSFAATEDSVPEPDVAVYPRKMRARLPRHALLAVEVALTSLTKDRKIKTAIYAEAGVPEYWIVNVRARSIEVHTQPERSGYAHVVSRKDNDVLRPASLHPFELRVSDIPWGPRKASRSTKRG